jgi:hypothetical protein
MTTQQPSQDQSENSAPDSRQQPEFHAKDWRAHRRAVANALNADQPATILDICCGDGWVPGSLTYPASVHGFDLYADGPEGYAFFQSGDFNQGVPENFGQYDAAICCEAMAMLCTQWKSPA